MRQAELLSLENTYARFHLSVGVPPDLLHPPDGKPERPRRTSSLASPVISWLWEIRLLQWVFPHGPRVTDWIQRLLDDTYDHISTTLDL